jgi:hypothetical protein
MKRFYRVALGMMHCQTILRRPGAMQEAVLGPMQLTLFGSANAMPVEGAAPLDRRLDTDGCRAENRAKHEGLEGSHGYRYRQMVQ